MPAREDAGAPQLILARMVPERSFPYIQFKTVLISL